MKSKQRRDNQSGSRGKPVKIPATFARAMGAFMRAANDPPKPKEKPKK